MGNPAAGDNSNNDEQIREDDGDLGDDADDDNDDKQKEKVRLREQNEKYLRWSFWIYPPPPHTGLGFFFKVYFEKHPNGHGSDERDEEITTQPSVETLF